jgi:4-amino-4-deoxy-L-arabinose transferase-like glycosyltransferase
LRVGNFLTDRIEIVKEWRLSRANGHGRLLIMLIPLLLSTFIHLYNPSGFPWIHEDEGHYLRRAMQVLEGLGPQETSSDFDRPYDHPYFGQLFLGSILHAVGYPDRLNWLSLVGDKHFIEMLYLAPRLLMGILAILDTFLVFMIAERKYNISVALIASVLFAIMPLTWLLRGIFLDNILLSFLLLSILFAICGYGPIGKKRNHDLNNGSQHQFIRKIILVLLSGIFLGIAIYTKAPAGTMIPLVAFVIYRNSKDFRLLTIWFIPVVLISALWPSYNIISDNLEEWIDGALWQLTERPEKTLSGSFVAIVTMDPVLITLGFAGLAYALVLETRKKDYFIVLWIIPYLIFLYLTGWVSYFHWVILIPGITVSAAVMINGVLNKIKDKAPKNPPRLIPRSTMVVISALGVFGLLSTTMLIEVDATSSYFELYSFVLRQIEIDQSSSDRNSSTTIVGHRWTWAFTWIPKYIYNDSISFVHFNTSEQIGTEKFLLLVDNFVKRKLYDSNPEVTNVAQALYNNSYPLKTFKDETTVPYAADIYPYTSMSENRGIGRYSPVEIRTNTT